MMTDRALSLFRTMLHPVLSNLPVWAGRAHAQLPVTPHFAVPAIQLGGVILHRPEEATTSAAEAMYGGEFRFADCTSAKLPDTVFTCVAPSSAWRSELLRMDWLASFRSSPKSLHGLYALRLISAWVSASPAYASNKDRIAALYNLAVDAPAIASRQSPAAIAIASAAIMQAQMHVSKLKIQSADDVLARCMALLAAHLAVRRTEGYRTKLVFQLIDALGGVLAADGSRGDGDVTALHELLGKLGTIVDGLQSAGEAVPPELSAHMMRISSYLSLLARPDGNLAFCDDADVKLPGPVRPRLESAVAETAGHARLMGGRTLLLANVGCLRDTQSVQLEVHEATTPLFWLEQVGAGKTFRRDTLNLMCAAGGSLLEVSSYDRNSNSRHIALFLSSDGADIRLEETSGQGQASGYVLHVADQAKLSTTNNGTGAMLVIANVAWQLLVRGGRVVLETGRLHIQPDGDVCKALNFALKRSTKLAGPGRSGKLERDAEKREKELRSPRLI